MCALPAPTPDSDHNLASRQLLGQDHAARSFDCTSRQAMIEALGQSQDTL